MSIRICEEGRADIIKSIRAYIDDRMQSLNSDWLDDEDRELIEYDIKYAVNALDQFTSDWDWYKLHDTLMAQDTDARELVFYYLRNVNEWLDFVEDQLIVAQGSAC